MIELLSTKLFIPRPRLNLVSRPRLTARLNGGLDKKLTLIGAPAGSGKTTLLSEWIPQSPCCVTWLSLDEADNDSTRFWAYFISSLQGLRSDLGEEALALLQSAQPPPITSILIALINDLVSFTDRFAIVLDDYHLINLPPIHEALSYLIAHLPANMHLVITTRVDPPLPLARLRARDNMTEFRSRDLRFTVGEVADFVAQALGTHLSAEEAAALTTRTEGWIAGLQIAALSMQGHDDISGFIHAFSGSHRHILGYLADEVLSQRPKGTLNFLLQTSILERLCGPLCDAVTGESGGQKILEELHHAHLFITPLDDQGKWYRYHHLFAEVLQARLSKHAPESPAELHRRASEWFEQNGFQAEAVAHALRGHDWSRASRLIEANIQSMQLRGEVATLLRWLGMLPEEAIQTRPTLALSHALMLTFVDDFAAAEQELDVAESALRSNPLPDASEQSALLGQAAAVRQVTALMLEYPGEAILAAGYEALRLLPENDLARRGYARSLMGCAYYLQLGDVQAAEQAFQEALPLTQAAGDTFSQLQIYTHLSQMRAIRGQLRAAEEACQELMQMAIEPGWENVPAAGLGGVMHGRILYERNDLPDALATLTVGITTLEDFSLKRAEIIGRILLARVQLALGEMDQARGILDRAWYMIQKYNLKQITMPAAAYRARLLLQMGDLEMAARWAATIEQPANDPLNPALEYDYITLARVWMAQGRPDESEVLLARLLPPAEAAGRMARLIEILALQAVVAHYQQHGGQARAALERGLILAEPEGFVRSFVDEGAPMAALLRQLRAQGLHLAYVNKLLAAFPTVVATPALANLLPEPLSTRELEVLRLVATGASNKDIANQLFIAVSTAKKHVSNMLVKLDAPNRTQAITRARALGLLP